jgi:hypothetical protein
LRKNYLYVKGKRRKERGKEILNQDTQGKTAGKKGQKGREKPPPIEDCALYLSLNLIGNIPDHL